MTAPEYIQLRAFARIDGVKLAILWLASFAFYVLGLKTSGFGLVSLLLAFATPFLSARLLRHFRDEGLEGFISFGRGWVYVVFQFFYAGLLFAIAQFVYFAYLDHGFFMNGISQMFSDPATSEAMRQMGMSATIEESLQMLMSLRPIDLALNILTSNLILGCLIAVPIAAICKRNRIEQIK